MAEKQGSVMIYQAIKPDGTALWEAERPLEWLLGVKQNMTDAFFNSQYQNDPSGLKGVLFNIDHLQYYLPHELPPMHTLMGFQGGDSAVSKESTADYYGHFTGGRDPMSGTIYLLDCAHDRFSSPEHQGFLRAEYDKWKLRDLNIGMVQVEYWGTLKGSGQELEERERRMPDPMPLHLIEAVKGQTNKQERLLALRPHFNGRVLFPGELDGQGKRQLIQTGNWREFLTQFASFPRGRYDDLLDALWVMLDAAFGHAMAAVHTVSQAEHDQRYNELVLQQKQEAQSQHDSDNALEWDEPRDAETVGARMNPLAMLYSNRGHFGRELQGHPAIGAARRRRRAF